MMGNKPRKTSLEKQIITTCHHGHASPRRRDSACRYRFAGVPLRRFDQSWEGFTSPDLALLLEAKTAIIPKTG